MVGTGIRSEYIFVIFLPVVVVQKFHWVKVRTINFKTTLLAMGKEANVNT